MAMRTLRLEEESRTIGVECKDKNTVLTEDFCKSFNLLDTNNYPVNREGQIRAKPKITGSA